jgi:hypothetical protein
MNKKGIRKGGLAGVGRAVRQKSIGGKLVLAIQSHAEFNRIPKRSPYRNVASILWSGM